MKGYESYKESGVEWIGQVPKHWDISKYKFAVNILSGFPFKSELFSKEKGFPLIRIRDISSGNIETFYDGDYSDDYIVKKDDLVVGMDGDFNIRWWNNIDALLNQRCCSIKAITGISNLRFLFYVIPNDLKIINDLAYYTTVKHLSSSDLYKRSLILPSLEDQTKVAAFLDYKTNLIDATIEKKKRLIALLKEKRQAVINEAVTKGLNPNAPMKESGVEWLGEIPEHWGVVKLKHVVEMRSGNFISAERIDQEGTFPVYGGNGLRGFTSDFTHEGFFPLIGRQGALCGNINYASGKFWATEHAVVVSPTKEINLYWIGELLRLMNLNQYSQASAQPGLSVEKILNLSIPFPNSDEQNIIATKIEDLNSKIDLSDLHLKDSIKKLQTYRQSIISEAVTGKIDVRDWQPPKNK